MGRQIALAASPLDEQSLLESIRDSAEIQLIRCFARSESELWVDDFDEYSTEATQYYIWNKRFSWKPTIARTSAGDKYFVEDIEHGPIIEFCRTDIDRLRLESVEDGAYGRVYWAGFNRQKTFAAWFDAIVRWIRRNGTNISVIGSSAVYALPDALSKVE